MDNIQKVFDEINDFNGKLIPSEEFVIGESCELFEINKIYGPGVYLTKDGVIKRYTFAEKTPEGKKTGVIMLHDKKICPVCLYPSRSIFVNNKNEIEVTDGKIKRMLTDEALINQRELRKYLQQFNREYWFDGDQDDVIKLHKLLIQIRKKLKIKTEKVNNQFGWVDGKFSPYDINVFIDDPVLKELEESFTIKGNKNEWLQNINIYRKNILFETQFLTALAAPLIKIINVMPMWVHLVGKATTSKTAAMIAIASIYGNPADDGKNLITSFNTTVVGLENRSHLFNNLPVFLNDSQNLNLSIRPEDLVYLAFEGKGRNRGQRSEQSRMVKRWTTTFITNGEKALLNKNAFEGAAKRCIQIEGVAMDLEYGKKVRRIFYDNYGHIGREWIEILKKINKKYLYEIYDDIYENLKNHENIDDNIQQVTTMCLAQYIFEIKINNISEAIAIKKAIETGSKILKKIDVTKDSADMCNKIINYLKDFVIQNISRFEKNNTLQHERFGFIKNDNVCIFNNKLDEILIKEFNYDVKLFRKEIRERGLVVLDSSGQIKKVRYGKTTSRYPQFLSEIIFGEEDNVVDADFEKKIEENEREGIQNG